MQVTQEEQALIDAIFLRKAMGLDKEVPQKDKGHRSILVAMSGLPGTGKSHFAGALIKQLPFLVLESDRIRKLLVAKPKYIGKEHSRVFSACYQLIEECLTEGSRVLFDATNLTNVFRCHLQEICHRLSVPILLVRTTAPKEIVRARLSARAAGLHPGGFSDAGWPIYCRLATYEEPIDGLHFTVDSSGNIASIVDEVARIAALSDDALLN